MVSDKPRSGRPRKLTKRGERALVLTAHKNCRLPFRDLGNLVEPNISERTVSSYLARHNYRRYVARKVPFLTLTHRHNRRKWARMFRHCGMGFWRRKIWSDECYVYLGDRRGRVYVTRRPDEVYAEDCLAPTFQQSSVRVMIWSCIGFGWKGPIVVLDYPGGKGGGMTAKRYQEQVLEAVLKDIYVNLEEKLGGIHFQQDGAASHRAKSTKKWLEQHNILLLFHPASSPDLNPIERVWHELKRRLRKRNHIPTSLDKLKQAIHDIWEEIPQEFIDRLIRKMPDCVSAVLAAKGGHTRY
jgi:transposase